MSDHNQELVDADGLIRQELRSTQFFDHLLFGVIIQDSRGVVIDCNASSLEFLGLERSVLIGRTFEDLQWAMIHEDGQPFSHDELPSSIALSTGAPVRGVIVGTGSPRQFRHWFFVDASPFTTPEGDTAIIVTLTKVTDRIMSRRLLRLHNAMSHTMMFSADENECLQQMCTDIVETGRFVLAWLGVKSSEVDHDVDVLCASGRTDYLYEGIVTWWGTEESGHGPTGTALREGATQIMQDLEIDLGFKFWRERAREYRLGSLVAIPFDINGRSAVITIYDESINTFDDETVAGLEEVVRQAQFGVAYQASVRQAHAALEEVTRANIALQRAEKSLIDSKEWYRLILANSSDVVLVLNRDGIITDSNPTHGNPEIQTATNHLGKEFFELVCPEDLPAARAQFNDAILQPGKGNSHVLRFRDRQREWRYLDVLMTNCLDDPIIRGVVLNARDVSQNVQSLGKLAESQHFLESIANNMVEGLIAVDLEGAITFANESAGNLLKWDPSDLIGKPAHETFHYKKRDGSPYPTSECPLSSVSLGVLSVDRDYFVQRNGSLLPVKYNASPLHAGVLSGRICVFEDISEKVAERDRVEGALEKLAWVGRNRDALDHGRFVLYAQPIVDLSTMLPVQHELLIRMIDQVGEVILPGKFLPSAEEFGLIAEIDRWVIDQSLELALAGHSVEFNLSAKSVTDPATLAFIARRLQETNAPAENLVCEVTETAFMHDMAVAETLVRGLRTMGIRVALDDFGSGYGGFTYLKRLPVSYLKIDREFIKDLKEEKSSRHVVSTVANLARAFNLSTIAEGAEDAETLEILQELGIDHVQGYVLGRPAPTSQVFTQRAQSN